MRLKRFAKKFIPVLTLAFILVVTFFLFRIFSQIEWAQVASALKRVSNDTLASMIAIAAVCYSILTSYDYMGFKFLRRKPLPYKIVGPTSLVCYAFNFNLGAIVGGLGFRVRIYSGWKVSKQLVPFVALFTVVTTWIGYTFLLSIICLFQPSWGEGPYALPRWGTLAAGLLGAGIVFGYLALCRRNFKVRFKKQSFPFPPFSMALAQIGLSAIQWCLAATIIYFFLADLDAGLGWGTVLFTYLVASIGGVIARIPAGLGVLEAIFIQMHPQAPVADTLAGILCFRAVYYILPLILAIFGYILIEVKQKKDAVQNARTRQNELPAR